MPAPLTPPDVINNSILRALTAEEYERIASSLTKTTLSLGRVIGEPDEKIEQLQARPYTHPGLPRAERRYMRVLQKLKVVN